MSVGSGIGIRGKDSTLSTCKSEADVDCRKVVGTELVDAWAKEPPRRLTDSTFDTPALTEEKTRDAEGYYDLSERLSFYDHFEENMSFNSSPAAISYHNSSRIQSRRNLAVTKPGQKKKRKAPKRQGGVYDPLVMYHNQSHTALNRYSF